MKSLVFPYGNAGWTEKRRFLEELLSSRPGPPYIYNDVLIIVPSSRMKRAYGRMLLDIMESTFNAAALVQPEIRTLHQFFESLYEALDGPRLIDENSRLVLFEGIVKELLAGSRLFSQNPDLLAPALSAALAKTIEQLSTAGVCAEELAQRIAGEEYSDKPQVTLLVNVYHCYEKVLKDRNLTDPAGMRAYVLAHAAPDALARYTRIIIDGLPDAGKREADILRKVADRGDCTCLLHASSPEMIKGAVDFHPLRLLAEFLSHLHAVPETCGVEASADERFLASVLFSDRPFGESAKEAPHASSFSKDLRVLSAINAREEVSLIAGEIKTSLRNGTAPDSILVAFPALDEYGPLVEELFTDYGIPYNRALGRQLSASPVAAAVVSLLRTGQEDFSGPSLLRIFSSPFLKFGETPELAPGLDRLMRSRRITGGKHRLLSMLRSLPPGEDNILAGPLSDLFASLEPFSQKDAAPLSAWMEQLSRLLTWSGLRARVALIKGPLNINLQAYKKLTDTLLSLSRAGKLFPDYQYTFSEWFFLLKKTLMHARFQVPPEDEGGVQLLGLEESIGHAWKEIYLGGLIDAKFPQRLPQNIFLPERTLETLGVRTLEKARLGSAYHFYRLLLSADRVTLTWPENEGDRPVVPSPFLEELTPLKNAGLINKGIGKTSGIQFTLKIEESHSIPELAKAISLGKDAQRLTDLFNTNIEGMPGIKKALEYASSEPAPTIAPYRKREFSVTELDLYLRCPYDYLVTFVLGLEPLEEATEDISPMDRGTKAHAILRDFYRFWNQPVTRGARIDARALLKKLADAEFDKEADTFRNRREKQLFLAVMTERFLDAEEEFWKQGMRPAYLERKIEGYGLILSNGEEVALSAKIDRIDVDADGNFLIVDYKTGKYPLPKMDIDQDIFQLPLYAVMALSALKDGVPGLKKPIGLVYYDLAGKTGAGARDVVLFNEEACTDQPSSKPKASPKSAREFEQILKLSTDRARNAAEGILAGDFSARPQDENRCRYCQNGIMCGIDDEP